MKIKVGCTMDIVGCEHEYVIEVDDDLAEEELEDIANESAHEHFDWWYEKVDD